MGRSFLKEFKSLAESTAGVLIQSGEQVQIKQKGRGGFNNLAVRGIRFNKIRLILGITCGLAEIIGGYIKFAEKKTDIDRDIRYSTASSGNSSMASVSTTTAS